jgi:hypothetical protein
LPAPKFPNVYILSEEANRPVRQFLTAGSIGKDVTQKGVFTAMLAKALDVAANVDGFVSGASVMNTVRRAVPNYAKSQVPELGWSPITDAGDMLFGLSGTITKTPNQNSVPTPTDTSSNLGDSRVCSVMGTYRPFTSEHHVLAKRVDSLDVLRGNFFTVNYMVQACGTAYKAAECSLTDVKIYLLDKLHLSETSLDEMRKISFNNKVESVQTGFKDNAEDRNWEESVRATCGLQFNTSFGGMAFVEIKRPLPAGDHALVFSYKRAGVQQQIRFNFEVLQSRFAR